MIRPLAAIALLAALAPAPGFAQLRDFGCVGAEALEDDVFAIPFAGGNATLRDAAAPGLDAAAALARAEPARNLCVLGHADRAQGAGTSTRLAAQRARTVAEALSARGVERDRIRAEARVGAFSGRAAEPGARSVTIVVMPAAP